MKDKILSIHYSKHKYMCTRAHTHTTCPLPPTHKHTPAHVSILTIQNLSQTTNRPQTDFRRRQTLAWNEKTWQLGLLFKKLNVFRFGLESSKKAPVGEEEENQLMQEGEKQQAQQPTVESLLRGIWKLTVSEAERKSVES